MGSPDLETFMTQMPPLLTSMARNLEDNTEQKERGGPVPGGHGEPA